MPGQIFMIPCPITDEGLQSLSPDVAAACKGIRYYVVERAKTARRFLKQLIPEIVLQDIEMIEMDHKDSVADIHAFLDRCINEGDIGVISEAGCPGVADPGHVVCSWAHEKGISVRPLVGPSAILLALMASGLSGQNFQFIGYMSAKKPELIKNIKLIEQQVWKTGMTTLFIETPYRNQSLWETLMEVLSPKVHLGIAIDLTGPEEFIRTKTIDQWKKEPKLSLPKLPAMFLIGTTDQPSSV